MSPVAGYSTLEEFLEQQRSLRSPTLPLSNLNYNPLDTPPPFVDAPDGYEPSLTETTSVDDCSTPRQSSKSRPKASLSDALLIKSLGPLYPPDIADRAGIELLVDDPESPCEDKHPTLADDQLPMIALNHHQDVSSASDQHEFPQQQALIAPIQASEKLNDAISLRSAEILFHPRNYGYYGSAVVQDQSPISDRREKRQVSVSVTSLATNKVSNLTLQSSSPETALDNLPPSRPHLPALRTDAPPVVQVQQRHDSISSSGLLAKFTITPSESHPSQTLPRLQNGASPASTPGQSLDFRQTLPSLETALSSTTDSNGTPYLDTSLNLSRLSPSQQSQYGLSPAIYSHSTPTTVMSPPRFSSNPASWRTLSQNSSNSTISENASNNSSGNSATPATRQSPSHSVSTPSQYPASEHESGADSDFGRAGFAPGDQSDINEQSNMGSQQGYSCTFPGCTAPPFQTQYLLNSHTNVHSNQRPHFCPVDGCPRGPGGQGFKRKNEMIRHGLVHQSPGYVCPFCPDQQHKYPRPDNLQRHVRVHHVEKDRDDPLLREVLAQRPEGGNRGRRRRLGG